MKLKTLRSKMALSLAVIVGLSSGVLPVHAVTGNEVAADNHYQGTNRVEGDVFEGYDINVDFDVVNGNFANIAITSENMARYNDSFRIKAENKLKELEGTPASVSNANLLDTVSSATYTANVGKNILLAQLSNAQGGSPVASVLDKFEANQVYEVAVQLRKMSEKTELSMANDFMAQKAEIWLDESGQLNITCQFPKGEKFGVSNAYVTGFKLLEDDGASYRPFTLVSDEENNSFGQVILPSVKEDGFYQGKIDANIMKNNDVFLLVDWNTMIGKGHQDNIFRQALADAKAVSSSFYSAKSYEKLAEALRAAQPVEQNPSASLAEKYLAGYQLREAISKLEEISSSPFLEANQRYFVDVFSQDDKIKSAINYEAVVENDAEKKSTIKVEFKKGENYRGEFIVHNVEVFNAEGERIAEQSYQFDEALTKGSLVFVPDSFPKSGTYKVAINHNQDNQIIHSSITFDWNTIRTGADYRPLRKLIETSKLENQQNYMEKSFAQFKAVLDEAEALAGRENETQESLNDMLARLEAAKASLMIIENSGLGKTVNTDLSHLSAPYVQSSEEQVEKDWAGSRIYFGKKNILWRVLDKENGLILADQYFVTSKYHNEKLNRAPRWNVSYMRDYLNTTLINELFSEAEQELIKTTTINQDRRTTEDKLFLLSREDYFNLQFGFSSNKSRSLSERQWTRTRGWSDVETLEVSGAKLGVGGLPHLKEYAARPALTLDMEKLAEKTLFVVTNDLDTSEGLMAVVPTTDNTWRVLLKDESISLSATDIQINNEEKVVGQYETNLSVGKLMAAIVSKENEKELKFYGKIGDIGSTSRFRNGVAATTGTFTFKLPEDFNKDTDQVVLFVERANQDGTSSLFKIPVEEALVAREALVAAKAEAKAELDKLPDLTPEHKAVIQQEIDQMTSPAQKDELLQKAVAQDAKDKEERLSKEAFESAKQEAKEAIEKLVNLTKEHRDEMLAKVEAMSDPQQKLPIIEEAKVLDDMDKAAKEKEKEDKVPTQPTEAETPKQPTQPVVEEVSSKDKESTEIKEDTKSEVNEKETLKSEEKENKKPKVEKKSGTKKVSSPKTSDGAPITVLAISMLMSVVLLMALNLNHKPLRRTKD